MTFITGPLPQLPRSGGVIRSPRGTAYVLGAQLGEGASGAVFDCLGPFDQNFALKFFAPRARKYAEVRVEWMREAERLYRLRHPNIVYVHDFFESDGLFYLVLERCDHSVEHMLATGPFTDRLVVDLARQLLFAVQYLADNDVIHNDLHAGNCLIVQGEKLTVKLSDLGIAQELYGPGIAKPHIVQHRLMAPEVAAGGYSTKQSDLYQLGLLMYQMHTGEYPLDTSQGYDAIVAQIREGVPRVKAEALGTPIGDIVSVMLRRHEQYRYTSAREVWEDLRKLDVWARDRVARRAESSRSAPRSGDTEPPPPPSVASRSNTGTEPPPPLSSRLSTGTEPPPPPYSALRSGDTEPPPPASPRSGGTEPPPPASPRSGGTEPPPPSSASLLTRRGP